MSRLDERHFRASSLREEYGEYIFLAGLCSEMWQQGRTMEILRSQTDAAGYDIVLECQHIVRHVQLKLSHLTAKTARQKINTALSDKPSGCVVWMRFAEATFRPNGFLWFGGAPGHRLPDLGDVVAKHSKGNATGFKAEREHIRVLPKRAFTEIADFSSLADQLFGPADFRLDAAE